MKLRKSDVVCRQKGSPSLDRFYLIIYCFSTDYNLFFPSSATLVFKDGSQRWAYADYSRSVAIFRLEKIEGEKQLIEKESFQKTDDL